MGDEFSLGSVSNLQHQSPAEQKVNQERTAYQTARGKASPPQVLAFEFSVLGGSGTLVRQPASRALKPTEEIRAKAAALTANLSDDGAKMRAIYDYVSTRFRYIGIDFGIGRYQPHSAADVLANHYGDCKDKHTLLSALLGAAGIKSFPALISSGHEIDLDVPSPAQFDHVISVISQGEHLTWLDTTPELAPFAYLSAPSVTSTALAILGDKPPSLLLTPADPERIASQSFKIQAKLDDRGSLTGKIARSLQGDDNELLFQ